MYSIISESFAKKAVTFVVALFAVVSISTSGFCAENAKVAASLAGLKEQTAALGAPSLDGETLLFGTTKVNGDFTVVDAVKEKFGGTATLFAKKGDSFVRVSTNVIKEGNRAVGTVLDPTGPAYAAIKKGESFQGTVDILGKFYDTGYEPIKNAAGETIGVYYVGYPVE